jgi:transposase-like protein
MRYVPHKDQRQVAKDLRPIYQAPNVEAAEAALEAFEQSWGGRYPMVAESWRAHWENITPFLSLPADLRKVVYTTNSIENLNRQIRKAIKTRGHFPSEEAATKLIYLAICRAETKWRTVFNWRAARRALKIHFGERMPD